eukprot:1853073-Alexandrium_andersonii.AAC.1
MEEFVGDPVGTRRRAARVEEWPDRSPGGPTGRVGVCKPHGDREAREGPWMSATAPNRTTRWAGGYPAGCQGPQRDYG